MHQHPAIQQFKGDHKRFVRKADQIDKALRHRVRQRPVEHAARAALAFADHELWPHLEIEDMTLMSVVREHMAFSHPQVILQDASIRATLGTDVEALRRAVQEGAPPRAALASFARELREYVRYEEEVLLPWVEDLLGDLLLREVDARLDTAYWHEREAGEEAPAVIPSVESLVPSR